MKHINILKAALNNNFNIGLTNSTDSNFKEGVVCVVCHYRYGYSVTDDSNDLVLSFSLSGGIFWRRGRQIIRYENLKDYLTFRVSYLY